MQIPLDLNKKSRTPLQQQLFDKLREAILMGRLVSGQRVPSSRELALQLNVSRNTVSLAYDRLIAEGYFVSRRGVGMFVTRHLPEEALHARRKINPQSCPVKHADHDEYHSQFNGKRPVLFAAESTAINCDFRIGRPDANSFPAKVWRRLANRILSQSTTSITRYGDPAGAAELRKAIVQHVSAARGVVAEPEQVIIVAGTQEALNLVSRVFLGNGTQVLVEAPTYENAALCFQSYGAGLVPLPTDESGIILERLPEHAPQLAYVTPSHQFPRGVTMSLPRRLQLLDYAARTGMYIFEDDYDGDFRFQGSPLTALQGLDVSDQVLYSTTFSKSIGAGLRLAYLIVPEVLQETFITAKALLNNGHPWLDQMILAEFISSGQYEKHLRRIRVLYMARRDCLVELLQKYFGPCHLSGQYCGLHLAWRLGEDLPPALELQKIASSVGVGLYPVGAGSGYVFADQQDLDRIVLLGYPSVPEPLMRKAIPRLAKALEQFRSR